MSVLPSFVLSEGQWVKWARGQLSAGRRFLFIYQQHVFFSFFSSSGPGSAAVNKQPFVKLFSVTRVPSFLRIGPAELIDPAAAQHAVRGPASLRAGRRGEASKYKFIMCRKLTKCNLANACSHGSILRD